MKHKLIILSFFLFSLTVFSCSEKDESTDSTTTTSSGLYVAVGLTGTILTTSDGTTWTSRTSGVSTDLNGITYGNSTFVLVGETGTILTSSDGTTWASRHSITTKDFKMVKT